MNKKRKIWGTTAAIAVIVSLLIVSIPAEEKEDKKDCGCGCNEAHTQGKPLNFYDLMEKTKGWDEDVALLEKEIKERKEELLELYKKTKEDIYWKEIEDLQLEIEKLESEYWYKKEVLFEIEVIRKYTELQNDGTLKIVRESLPEIEDLDFQIAFNRQACELTGEQITMQKYPKLNTLLEEAKGGKDVWGEIIKLEKEINTMKEKEWSYRKEFSRLKISRNLSENNASILTTYCWPYTLFCGNPDDPLPAGNRYLYYWRPIKVWIGMYSSSSPNTFYYLGEFCSTYFTTNMNYYWNLAKNKNSNTKSIQVKWFYLARATYDGRDHDIIWEKNKNATTSWPTPGYADYTTTHKNNGYYGLGTPCYNKMVCCYNGGCHWCNDHCDGCFACDSDACQHFVTENP